MLMLVKNKTVKIALLAFPAAVLLIALPFLMPNDYWRQILNQALIYIVIVVGYNFVTGDLGQLSMAQQGFFALGAYTTAILSTTVGLSWWTSVGIAIVLNVVVGAIVGLPTLRLRAQYLVMVTLAFSEIIRLLATNLSGLTGGAMGIIRIPSPRIGTFVFVDRIPTYFLFLAITSLAVFIAYRIRVTKYGRAFIAIRDGELAADVMGINTYKVKIVAFALSAAYAGLGGGMFAGSFNFISPDSFTLSQTILILAMLLVGGEGIVAGAIVGAITLTFLPEILRFAREFYMLIYGVMIVMITLFLPGGVVGFSLKYLRKFGIIKSGVQLENAELIKKPFDFNFLLEKIKTRVKKP